MWISPVHQDTCCSLGRIPSAIPSQHPISTSMPVYSARIPVPNPTTNDPFSFSFYPISLVIYFCYPNRTTPCSSNKLPSYFPFYLHSFFSCYFKKALLPIFSFSFFWLHTCFFLCFLVSGQYIPSSSWGKPFISNAEHAGWGFREEKNHSKLATKATK